MTNEIIYGITGLAGGLMIGNASGFGSSTCPENISTPLQNQYVTPSSTIDDYLLLKEWGIPGEKKKKDMWNANILSDGTNIYQVIFWWDFGTSKLSINTKKIYPVYQETGSTLLAGSLTIDGDLIKIIAGNASMTVDTRNFTVNSILSSPSINIIQTGRPFKFNDGADGVVIPYNWYMNGLEFPGMTSGIINGVSLSGFGVLERLNWNFEEFSRPGYRWIAFSTNNNIISGLLCRVNLYQDGGVWYNNIYYKVRFLDISTLTRTPEWYKANEEVVATLDDGINSPSTLLLQMNKIYTDMNGLRNYYYISAYINGAPIGNGYAWQDHSII